MPPVLPKAPPKVPPGGGKNHPGERLAKQMARAGACSRREAERWIEEGRVKVNGLKVTSPALNVTESDQISIDGKPLSAPEKTRLFLFHKPAGLVTSARDEKGRETVFSGLPAELPRLVSVGRLDLNSEGLLLLTNDGGLARHLELPAQGLARCYRARVHGTPDWEKLEALQNGITIAGVRYGPIEITPDSAARGSNAWMIVTLHEGKNREIRKVMEHFGLAVNRLIRLSYGPFELGTIPKGALKEVPLGLLKRLVPDYFGKAPKRT